MGGAEGGARARSGSEPWGPPPTPWPTAAPGGAGRDGGALHRPYFLCAPRLRFSDLLRSKISPLARPPRSPRSPSTTTPLRLLDVLSARGERAHLRVLRKASPAPGAFVLVIGPRPRQPGVSPRAPTPPSSTALIGSIGGLSPLLVTCSGFNDFQHSAPSSTCSCFWGFISFVPFRLRH
jgi:hypothetical protein